MLKGNVGFPLLYRQVWICEGETKQSGFDPGVMSHSRWSRGSLLAHESPRQVSNCASVGNTNQWNSAHSSGTYTGKNPAYYITQYRPELCERKAWGRKNTTQGCGMYWPWPSQYDSCTSIFYTYNYLLGFHVHYRMKHTGQSQHTPFTQPHVRRSQLHEFLHFIMLIHSKAFTKWHPCSRHYCHP